MKIYETMQLPEDVDCIISVLNENGYQAYAVGGCVRDSVMGRRPNDWDITTNALPLQVKGLFPRTVDTGIKHGTVTILTEGSSFEVTTYRIDGLYTDNRRPENVSFTSYLEEDLARRDFTMNAIAYHPAEGFVDPFNGLMDITAGIIRTVGDANARFREDALRMLRAVRFSAQLGFDVDDAAIKSICDNNQLIKSISAERIRDELTKILVSERPFRFVILRDTGLLHHIIPELEVCFTTEQNHPYHMYNVAMHSLKAVSDINNDSILRWTMLLHDIGKPLTKTTDEKNIDHFYGHPHVSVRLANAILRRLRFDMRSTDGICRLVEHHDRRIEPTPKAVRKAANAVGEDILEDLLKVQEADRKAQNPRYLDDRLIKLNEVRKIFEEIKSEQQCISLKQLAVNGQDLIGVGFTPGKDIGRILTSLLNRVLENPELNTSEKLLELAQKQSQPFRGNCFHP